MKLRLVALFLFIAAICVLIVRCSTHTDNANNKKPVKVSATPVIKSTVPYTLDFAGYSESYSTVNIQSMVTGQLLKINFQDGSDVKKGDLLFKIDDRSFRNNLAQAEANLLRDQVSLLNAIKEEERYRALLAQGAVSAEDYEKMLTARDTLNAAVMADNAAIMSAKLQIEYSEIRAPIDGKLGESMVGEGDIIDSNNPTAMVVINRITPILVKFSVPEQYLSQINSSNIEGNLFTRLKDCKDEVACNGKIDFIDNTVDSTSGTIKLGATFPNIETNMWPGQFVKVTLHLYNEDSALIVPAKALQLNGDGQYVFVVGSDNTVSIRPIVIDFKNNEIAVIKSGLKEGEIVVINGQLRLRSGSAVTVE